MKKSLLIAAAVMITFGACTNDDSAPVQNEISFKAINYKNTKAAINDAFYPTTVSFGVFAYYLPTGTWAANGTTASEYMNDVNVSYDGATTNIFKPAKKYYWPNQGSLTFVAYSPETVVADYTVSNKTLTITDYSCNQNYSLQSDLMYSKGWDARDKSANNSAAVNNNGYSDGVQILFRHALSQIRFFAKPKEASTTTQFNVLKVELQNINNKGTLNVVEDNVGVASLSWTMASPSSNGSFVTYDQTAITPQTITTGVALDMSVANSYRRVDVVDANNLNDNNLLVIPQTFTDNSCVIAVTYRMWVGDIDAGEKTKSVAIKDILPDHKFEPNTIYNMNFSISADEILFAPQIESWDVQEVTSGEGELK